MIDAAGLGVVERRQIGHGRGFGFQEYALAMAWSAAQRGHSRVGALAIDAGGCAIQ